MKISGRMPFFALFACGLVVMTTASCERAIRRALDPNGRTGQPCDAADYVQLLGQDYEVFDRDVLPRRWSRVPFGGPDPENIVSDNALRLFLGPDNRIIAVDCEDGGPTYRHAG